MTSLPIKAFHVAKEDVIRQLNRSSISCVSPLPHHGEQHPGSGHHHHRQPERPGPAPGSGLRPPCKKLPQRNSLWGSFYRAGRTLSRGEQLGDWWQLRRVGRLERFRRGGCGGGSSCACCCRDYSPWTCMPGLRLSSMQPEICEYSMPLALCINVFSSLCLVLFRPALLRRFNRNLAKTQPIRLYTGKSVKFCP